MYVTMYIQLVDDDVNDCSGEKALVVFLSAVKD
jgi:hypothetical protein